MSTASALWILARPKLLPYVALLPFLGWAWAHWDRALQATGAGALGWVMVAWALLHAGTLWLNAAVDRDEGEVLMGRAVEPPPTAAPWGYVALLGAVIVAGAAHPLAGLACLGSAGLSIAYSHPAMFWKAHPVGGPLVNLVGYGLLSPLAGWSVVGVDPNPRTLVVWAMGAMGVLGAYFSAQAFQQREDTERGYRTLVATHGPQAVLRAARICIGLAFVGGLVLAVAGWIPRSCILATIGWVWVDRWLARWGRQRDGGNESWAREFARRMAWAILLGIMLAFGEYARDSFAGRPVAGLGTVAGHPSDRPLLSPMQMKTWKQSANPLR
ncbi:MAG: UbiA family prenyltransferase [Myxococcales bacterium]|nr:UbiA family prenyltransferase [Myxococcales bacterium]